MKGFELVKTCAKETLEEALRDMRARGHMTMEIDLTNGELEYLTDLVRADMEEDREGIWETAYFAGYQYGYQMAVKDMMKKLKEVKWYGGTKQEKRAAGVPEHHAGRTADYERQIQRAESEEGHGGSMGAGTAEG